MFVIPRPLNLIAAAVTAITALATITSRTHAASLPGQSEVASWPSLFIQAMPSQIANMNSPGDAPLGNQTHIEPWQWIIAALILVAATAVGWWVKPKNGA